MAGIPSSLEEANESIENPKPFNREQFMEMGKQKIAGEQMKANQSEKEGKASKSQKLRNKRKNK
jgi:hypothetical protein